MRLRMKRLCQATGSRRSATEPLAMTRKRKLQRQQSRTKCLRPLTFLGLPPEMLDRIISFLPVRDVVALGETCRFLNNICNSQPSWKRICQRMNPRVKTANWRKAAILNYTKAIYSQPFRGQWHVLTCPVGLSVANGFQRILPTRDHMFVLDYDGTLFLLHIDMAFYNHGVVRWKAVSHYTVLAHKVKDFCGDPKSVSVSFKYLYVLMSQTEDAQEQLLEGQVAPSPAPCDCVELYQQSDGQRVFKLQFHPSMVFKQIALLGEETQRILLLLTDLGTLYYEIHSHGVYRNLFGTLQPFGSFDTEMPIVIPLSCKVVLCSISKNHLALADEHGRIFTQGNNRYGQLGTGDRTDRGQPSQVAQMKWPVQIWCGLNHTLILIQERDMRKEIFGCGCGAGGRLPGWARGSPVFVKLHVQVPLCTRYICSTRECLYMVCGYDTEEGTLYRHLPDGHEGPPGTHTGGEETGKTYQNYMSQLLKCSSPREHVAKAKEIVAQMPLQGQQKDFLWEALNVILRASDS